MRRSFNSAQFDKSIADTLVKQVKTKTTLKVRAAVLGKAGITLSRRVTCILIGT